MTSCKYFLIASMLSILAALGLANTDAVETDNTCCRNYNETYVVSYDYENWYQALINCESAGMQLATIKSREDNENFEKFLSENGYSDNYWLGATNLGNGNYYWATTGSVVVYTNWLTNEPDNSESIENCLEYVQTSTTNVTGWNDLNCISKLRYVCEKEPCCSNSCNSCNGGTVCWCQTEVSKTE